MRKFGAELELLIVNEKGIPITWKNWLDLKSVFIEVLPDKKEIKDITGSFLGFEIPGLGTIGLDSSASLFELGIEPSENIESAMEKISRLIKFVEKTLKHKGYKIFWKSQYPGMIDRENYNRRFSRRGLYPILRKIWKWDHHELYLSASFQPAIDVDPVELPHVLNAIFVTSPIYISRFGGNGKYLNYYEYRLKAWELMIKNSPIDKNMLGIPYFFTDTKNYLDSLLNTRAKIIGNYKHGERIFFVEPVSGREVIHGTTGQKLTKVYDMEKDEFDYENVYIKGNDLILQMDWWVFWDARWRFGKRNGFVRTHWKNPFDLVLNEIDYSYIEIRHIGTPENPEKLREIFTSFLRLFESSQMILKVAERYELFENLNLARSMAIKHGFLPENHRKFEQFLIGEGVIP